MSTIRYALKISLWDWRQHLHWFVAVALALSLGAAAVLRVVAPPPTLPWAEWHALEAHYEADQHALVIERSYTLHDPCPLITKPRRRVTIYDKSRQPYVFWTENIQPVDNRLGRHIVKQALVLPLRDTLGNRLPIVPDTIQVTIFCGARQPIESDPVKLDDNPWYGPR